MDLGSILVGFILGASVTVLVVIIINVFETIKVIRNGAKMFRDGELVGSFKYRLKDVEKCTKEQLELLDTIKSGGGGGASLIRWKNELAARVRELEAEKVVIFKSIIADGLDPEMSFIRPDGDTERIKMSAAILLAEASLEQKTDPIPPQDNNLLKLVPDEGNTDEPNPSTETPN